MINMKNLSLALTERFGLEVEAVNSKEDSGQKITIRPCGIEPTISFKVELFLGWRTVTAHFIPGNYASGLVAGIRNASASQQAAFTVFSESLRARGAKVRLELDHRELDPSSPYEWPGEWTSIQISMRKIGVIVEKSGDYDFDAVFPWATGFFGLSIALLPFEEVNDFEIEGEPEGAVIQRQIKQYERSRINRAACIEIHGTSCKICGFSFGERFGDLGKGFIHIHHVVPISEMNGEYILNPGKDLMPVCPNCHAMLHRKKPALRPEALINFLR